MEITPSGLLAAAHLVGADGLKTFFDSNGAIFPVDGNGSVLDGIQSVLDNNRY